MRHVGFYAGLFLVAAATLMLQLVQTRILSVVSWYHLAFFVISIAMFGLTAGSVWVYLRRERFTEATLSHDLTYFSSALALTTVLGFAAQLTLAPLAKPSLISVLIWAELAICLAIPFFFAGVVVSLALTRSPFPIGRVYGADLAGAALGSIGVLALLNTVDGPSAVLWIAAIAALAAVLFATSTIGTAPPRRPPLAGLLRRPAALLAVLILVAIANNFASPRGLHPVFVKGRIEAMDIRIFEEWNSFSRIIVFDTSNPRPQMWGPSPRFEPEDVAHSPARPQHRRLGRHHDLQRRRLDRACGLSQVRCHQSSLPPAQPAERRGHRRRRRARHPERASLRRPRDHRRRDQPGAAPAADP